MKEIKYIIAKAYFEDGAFLAIAYADSLKSAQEYMRGEIKAKPDDMYCVLQVVDRAGKEPQKCKCGRRFSETENFCPVCGEKRP